MARKWWQKGGETAQPNHEKSFMRLSMWKGSSFIDLLNERLTNKKQYSFSKRVTGREGF